MPYHDSFLTTFIKDAGVIQKTEPDDTGRRAGDGVRIAIRACGGQLDSSGLALSCELLSPDLLEALRR
jgi:hypothetical protein